MKRTKIRMIMEVSSIFFLFFSLHLSLMCFMYAFSNLQAISFICMLKVNTGSQLQSQNVRLDIKKNNGICRSKYQVGTLLKN